MVIPLGLIVALIVVFCTATLGFAGWIAKTLLRHAEILASIQAEVAGLTAPDRVEREAQRLAESVELAARRLADNVKITAARLG